VANGLSRVFGNEKHGADRKARYVFEICDKKIDNGIFGNFNVIEIFFINERSMVGSTMLL
jgi:hypothetical protein